MKYRLWRWMARFWARLAMWLDDASGWAGECEAKAWVRSHPPRPDDGAPKIWGELWLNPGPALHFTGLTTEEAVKPAIGRTILFRQIGSVAGETRHGAPGNLDERE